MAHDIIPAAKGATVGAATVAGFAVAGVPGAVVGLGVTAYGAYKL